MSSIFHSLFYQPILNALGVLAFFLPYNSFGVAIILLTLIINFILLPFTHKAKRSQKGMQALQPELDRIKKQYKDKREEQARKTLELYKSHGINPFSGFLVLIVQIPLFFALFRILGDVNSAFESDIYSFLPELPQIHTTFLSFIDLTEPFLPLAFVAALLQYIQSSLLIPKNTTLQSSENNFTHQLQQQMKFVIPVVVIVMGFTFPSALMLYWTAMSFFGIVHERVVQNISKLPAPNHGNDTRNKGENTG